MNRKIVVAVVALLIGLTPVQSVAQEPQKEPAPPIERLKRDLKGVANNITNAKMRMRRDMSGMAGMSGDTADAPGKPATPAETCCRSNIERINKKIEQMTRTLEHLYVYYTERRDSQALQVVDTIQVELHAISRGIAVFKLEGTKDSAQQALAGLLRPFNRLRKAIDELGVCCAVDPAVWSEPKPERSRP